MSKIAVIPDVHGRQFWKSIITRIDDYDHVIFLGDYLDPYQHDNISVEDAIKNFKDIITFYKDHKDKVILLLGNHDMPYYSSEYFKMFSYHCRHSYTYHDMIYELFDDIHDAFNVITIIDNIIFTHAGVTNQWIDELNSLIGLNIDVNSKKSLLDINNLLKDNNIEYLGMVSSYRGGTDIAGSCMWADINEHRYIENNLDNFKQIFGHTINAFYGDFNEETGKCDIIYGDGIIKDDYMMLDCAKCFELDTDKFTVSVIDG